MLPHCPLALPPTPSLDDSHGRQLRHPPWPWPFDVGNSTANSRREHLLLRYVVLLGSGVAAGFGWTRLQRIEAALVVCLDFNFSHFWIQTTLIPFLVSSCFMDAYIVFLNLGCWVFLIKHYIIVNVWFWIIYSLLSCYYFLRLYI